VQAIYWLCFALYGGQSGGAAPHPQRSLRSCKLDRSASGSLRRSHAHMRCWALQATCGAAAAVHVVARAWAIHGILNWATGRHSVHTQHLALTPANPNIFFTPTFLPLCHGQRMSELSSVRDIRCLIHRSSLRRQLQHLLGLIANLWLCAS
jgi:hypothetical protein